MKKYISAKKYDKKLLLLFFIALFLRIYKLGTFPIGFHADEARVGWNAFSILKTGFDDRGNILSLYYNTFGDFRPTGIFYLTIPSIFILGLNEFAVRFPSSLLGAMSIFPLYLLAKELQTDKKIPYLAAFFIAVSPWHISVSRATSEVAISMFFVLFALYFFTTFLKKNSKKHFALTIVFFLISYFFYHSARVLVPAFVAVLLASKWVKIKNVKIKKVGLFILGFLSLITLLLATNKEARGRFTQVSVFHDLDIKHELSRMPFEEGPNNIFVARLFHNKPLVYARRFVKEYSNYFSANFILGDEGKPQRYMTPGIGVLTYLEGVFLVLGLLHIAKTKDLPIPLLLLMVAPFAAALTTEDAPNLHRSFYMIPFISIIQSYGVTLFGKYKKYSKMALYTLTSLLLLNLIFYFHMYYTHAKYTIAQSRSYGAKQLAETVNSVRENYDQIVFTNIPDDPYPWLAFFGKYDPSTFNKSAIFREHGVWTHNNMVFSGQRCPSRDIFTAPTTSKIMVVDAEGCSTESNLNSRDDVWILKEIKRPDESVVFTLWTN